MSLQAGGDGILRSLERTIRSAALGLVLVGCTSFSFYEDSKVGVSLAIDPKAPDPVEVSASFKESVFAVVPVNKDLLDGKTKDASSGPRIGSLLSDFDVRFGATAGGSPRWNEDILYAVLGHGIATGKAASILAARSMDELLARKVVILDFVERLNTKDLKTAADALNVSGVGDQEDRLIRGRIVMLVRAAPSVAAVKDLEAALKAKLPAFQPWTRPT